MSSVTNYKANVFNGSFDGADRIWDDLYWGSDVDITTIDSVDYTVPIPGTHLVMKWDKRWDMAVFGPDGVKKNGDELPWEIGAWVTNHDTWTDEDGTHTAYYKIEYVGPGNGGVHFDGWGDSFEITAAVYDGQRIIK